ncbi:7-carboxy-7-deazaguanine synthase [Litorimonas sp. RW-G-Af-16]|uniref:7-carboxy-7-deazaguanine synthase n=1 Tax=Litorimonas sp. RW-G-Af-16 TaxID=3241168 RepID=UPI00390C9059
MVYSVKEIYLTVQGEGAQTGRVAVFLRFAGCNLWSGLEKDRATAQCQFCDTQFVGTDGPGGGKFKTAQDLAAEVATHWRGDIGEKWVICTGGEPLLQLDAKLIAALHAIGFKVAVETNGTLAAPEGLDWICVSPKADVPIVQTSGQELKLVYPQMQNDPADFAHLAFENFCLQPLDAIGDPAASVANAQAAFEYCLAHPKWRLSVQTHKSIGVP